MAREVGNGSPNAGKFTYPSDYPFDQNRTWRPFIKMESGAGEGQKPPDPAPGTLTMTQADLDRIVSDRLARDRATRGGAGQSEEEKAELSRLRQAEKDRQTAEAERKGEWDRLRKSMEDEHSAAISKLSETGERLMNELNTERVRGRLVGAAAKSNAIDPEEIADVLERYCDLNDALQPVVKDRDGNIRYIAGREMSPEQLVEEHLGKRSHLVKPGSTGQGGGSRGGASTGADGPAPVSGELEAARKDLQALDVEARRVGTPEALNAAWQAEKRVKALEAAAQKK